jgi:16S rRNA pseudouridine516 synthase
MRLDKLIAHLGYGTRKEVRQLITTRSVMVSGVLCKDPGSEVRPESDDILIRGTPIYYKEHLVIMMHKPVEVLSSTHEPGETTVMDLLDERFKRMKLSIAGRLDKDASGLILLTNDGGLLHRIIAPNKNVYKYYEVRTEFPIKNGHRLEQGVQILDARNQPFQTRPARIEIIDEHTCIIAISEGKYHQVKRMFLAIDNHVIALKRIAIGMLQLDPLLEAGAYREVLDSEIPLIFASDSAQ